MNELPELLIPDASAWAAWLAAHGDAAGVWLVLAKKGATEPTSLTYDQALEAALCEGWIDGQLKRRDDVTFRQRFTPRRARSPWSARNVGLVEQLAAAGRLRPRGVAAIEAAKSDGRWERAYAGSATATVPADFVAALAASPVAQAAFEALSRGNRYAVLYRLGAAVKAETRQRRIAGFVAMLERGETFH